MGRTRETYLWFFDGYSKVAGLLASVSLFVACTLLVALTFIILLSVFFRYVLYDPLTWSEEIARYLLIWMILIAASVAAKERKHVRLTTFLTRLPPRAQIIIDLALSVIIIFVIGLILIYSVAMLINLSLRTRSPSLQISMLWAHMALPVGFLLILIQSFYTFFEDLALLIKGESLDGRPGG